MEECTTKKVEAEMMNKADTGFSVSPPASRASHDFFTQHSNYLRDTRTMIESHLEAWLNELELNLEQKVLAGLALRLAKSFDESANTSTAAELRKTVLELQSQIKAGSSGVDPLEKLLTR